MPPKKRSAGVPGHGQPPLKRGDSYSDYPRGAANRLRHERGVSEQLGLCDLQLMCAPRPGGDSAGR
jgi:hypothetical protein